MLSKLCSLELRRFFAIGTASAVVHPGQAGLSGIALHFHRRSLTSRCGQPTRLLLDLAAPAGGAIPSPAAAIAGVQSNGAPPEVVERQEVEEDDARALLPTYSDIARNPFADDSIAENADTEEEADTATVRSSPLEGKRRRYVIRAQRPTSEEKEKAREHVASVIEKAAMQDPKALDYPLHTYQDISPVIYNSIKAHTHLFAYVSTRDCSMMRRHFADREAHYKTQLLGKALYVRVVNLRKLPQVTDTKRGSLNARVEKSIVTALRKILSDYSRQLIEPFPNEIACDVSHYAAAAPYVAAAKINVQQFVIDAKSLCGSGTIPKKGLSGAPTSQRKLKPLSPEDIAKEIAARVSREVLRPVAGELHRNGSSSSSEASVADKFGGFRVCIGAAQTPAMAKIACDAEVLQISRHSEKGAHRVPPVRVRSFYQHIRTLRDSKNFMTRIRVAHVPVFTPAFARFLQEVFNIDTCAQLYQKRNELFFNLSKETFDICYDAIYGRMRFAVEEQQLLYSAENLRKTNESIEVLATNAIAIANDTRTALRGGFLSITKDSLTGAYLSNVDARLNYGRLFNEEQFMATVSKTLHKAMGRLHHKGLRASGMRVDIRRGLEVQFVVTKSFPATNNYSQMMSYAREAAVVLAPHRQQKGAEHTGEFFCISIVLTGLDLAVMIPERLEAELQDVKKKYIDARVMVSSKNATTKSALAAARAAGRRHPGAHALSRTKAPKRTVTTARPKQRRPPTARSATATKSTPPVNGRHKRDGARGGRVPLKTSATWSRHATVRDSLLTAAVAGGVAVQDTEEDFIFV